VARTVALTSIDVRWLSKAVRVGPRLTAAPAHARCRPDGCIQERVTRTLTPRRTARTEGG